MFAKTDNKTTGRLWWRLWFVAACFFLGAATTFGEVSYDVIVAGGGPSGIGAAYMAAKRGAKVLLLEKSGRLGGMAVQAMVSPFTRCTESPTVERIMAALHVGRTVDFASADVRAFDLLRTAGADVLLHATVLGPTMDGCRVTGVETLCAEGRRTFAAQVVIDATGDGLVAAGAGVPYEMGRAGDGLVQPMSIMFTVGGIEPGRRVWCGSEEEARRWMVGSRSWEEIVQAEIAGGRLPPEVGVIRLYDGPTPCENTVNATQVNRLFGVKSADLTTAEIVCRKQAFQVVDVLKRHVPGYANAYVSGMPAVVGVRETRRFEGVERLETSDCLSGRHRTNAIARQCSFVVDIHNPAGSGQADQHDAYATGEARRVKPYDIPYGAIVPRKVDGILFCGRCLSASHEALASCRVMGCAMATGVGAGAAAAEAVKRGIALRDVNAEDLRLFEEDAADVEFPMPNAVRSWAAPEHATNGVKAVWLEGVPWKGKETRIFAYYSLPKWATAAKKAPGIVLVHGGGGTAFHRWARTWAARGYAAIAMDTCGGVPFAGEYSECHPRHAWSGPNGWGCFADEGQKPEDQWMYHAVEAVIRAHTFLRNLPEVDESKVGVTGISWGGVLTAVACGVDSRFAFAAPVYGCGNLRKHSVWSNAIGARWDELWDPAKYARRCRVPTLWCTGTNDHFFPLDSLAATALPTGNALFSIKIRMPHGQWEGDPPEIAAFADSVTKGATALTERKVARRSWVYADSAHPVWEKREFTTSPVRPAKSTILFENIETEDGLVISSAPTFEK